MSSDKKPKRRQKKNSEVSQFVTRFRVQPPEPNTSAERHANNGSLKFFHWKYNEADSIITDDAASVPSYPDQDLSTSLPDRSASNRYPSNAAINSTPTSHYTPRAQKWIQDITNDHTPQLGRNSALSHPVRSAPPSEADTLLRQQQRQQQLELLYKQRGLPVPPHTEAAPVWNKMALADSYAQQYYGQPPIDIAYYLPFLSPNSSSSAPMSPGSDAMDVDSETIPSKVMPTIPEKRIPMGAQHVSFPDGATGSHKYPVGGSFTRSQHSAFKPPSATHSQFSVNDEEM